VASPGSAKSTEPTDGNSVNSFLLADFDADGAIDIVTGSGAGSGRGGGVALLRGDPQARGNFRAPKSYFLGARWSADRRAMALADLNKDTRPDLVAFTATFDLLRGRGDASFESSLPLLGSIAGPGEFYNTLKVADFDKNGSLDLLWLATGGVQGGPGPRHLVAYADESGALHTDCGSNPSSCVHAYGVSNFDWAGRNAETADFNGDGYLDFAVFTQGGSSGALEIYLNGGASSPQSFTRVDPNVNLGQLATFPDAGMVAADFDRDGRADIVTHVAAGTTGTNHYVFLKGNGNGTFQPAADFAVNRLFRLRLGSDLPRRSRSPPRISRTAM
jgi:hypothetical protein